MYLVEEPACVRFCKVKVDALGPPPLTGQPSTAKVEQPHPPTHPLPKLNTISKPSPLRPKCSPAGLSAPLSAQVLLAPQLLLVLRPPVATQLQHQTAPRRSPQLLSSVLTEPTRVLWYDSLYPNSRFCDGGVMRGGSIGSEAQC